jgi:shikimate 5-dehydrogenase
MINKDTLLFGSFSENPGNNGCEFFNSGFKKHKIDAIYKSFYSNDIERTVDAVKHLNFSGFALSMPLKGAILPYLDVVTDSVMRIGAANTIIHKDEQLWGYNTDYIGVYDYFKDKDLKFVSIIGNGGFSKAIQYAFDLLKIGYVIYYRNDIDQIDEVVDRYFINATPAEITSKYNTIIDGRPFTETGREIFKLQALEQFKLYTGKNYV